MFNLLRRSRADRALALRALLLLGVVRIGLWTLPFRLLRRMTEKATRSGVKPANPDPRDVGRVSWAVDRASRCVPGATCLTQAIAASILLARHGLDAKLHIGVAKAPGEKLAAHAWVTSQGHVVIGGSDLRRFQPLLVLESDRT